MTRAAPCAWATAWTMDSPRPWPAPRAVRCGPSRWNGCRSRSTAAAGTTGPSRRCVVRHRKHRQGRHPRGPAASTSAARPGSQRAGSGAGRGNDRGQRQSSGIRVVECRGRRARMEAGNAALGLRDTWPHPGGSRGLATTSAADQLRLLADLASPRSPLSAPARSYELSLMRHVEPSQRWGVAAAADPGTRPAVKDGWLPVGPQGTWIINSIGVIRHGGQQLLIAVLSSGQPSESSGIRQVQAAPGRHRRAAGPSLPPPRAAGPGPASGPPGPSARHRDDPQPQEHLKMSICGSDAGCRYCARHAGLLTPPSVRGACARWEAQGIPGCPAPRRRYRWDTCIIVACLIPLSPALHSSASLRVSSRYRPDVRHRPPRLATPGHGRRPAARRHARAT